MNWRYATRGITASKPYLASRTEGMASRDTSSMTFLAKTAVPRLTLYTRLNLL